MFKKIGKQLEKVVKNIVKAPEKIILKPIKKLFELPKNIVTSVQFVFNSVKEILFGHRSWVESEIEPPVTDYIGSIEGTINSSQNPEVFGRAATLKKEKEMIYQAYHEMRTNLTANDIQKLDALSV